VAKMKFFFALIALKTALGQSYCNSGPTTTIDSNLGVTQLTGKSKSINEQSTCPGTIGPIDATHLVADLIPGKNYSLVYNVITCGNLFPIYSGAWIDYNQNLIFEDWEGLGFSNQSGLITLNFMAPNGSNVHFGSTRLRVQVQETSGDTINPCSLFAYGGTKDFTVEIINEFPGYCNCGPMSTLDTEMGQVFLKGENRNIVENTGCPGSIGPVNYTSISADLIIGNTYDINYTVITCSDLYPNTSSAWIDWNQNQIWDQWEQIFPFSRRGGFQSYAFKVPKSTASEEVKPGFTRLRIQVQEVSFPSIDPCALFAFGGTKDFGIEVKREIDGGWGDWQSCNASCGGGWQVRHCNNPTPSAEGAPCVGQNVTSCNTNSCGASGSTGGKVAAGILIPLIIIGGLLAFYIYRKKKREDTFETDTSSETTPGNQYQAAV